MSETVDITKKLKEHADKMEDLLGRLLNMSIVDEDDMPIVGQIQDLSRYILSLNMEIRSESEPKGMSALEYAMGRNTGNWTNVKDPGESN